MCRLKMTCRLWVLAIKSSAPPLPHTHTLQSLSSIPSSLMELHNERDVSIVLPTITSDAQGWVTGAGVRAADWGRRSGEEGRGEEGLEKREKERKTATAGAGAWSCSGWFAGSFVVVRFDERNATPRTEAPRQHGAVDRDFSYTAIRQRGRTVPALKGSLELNSPHNSRGRVKGPLTIKYKLSPLTSAGQNVHVLLENTRAWHGIRQNSNLKICKYAAFNTSYIF